jgi:alanyl-tRNA synthetase
VRRYARVPHDGSVGSSLRRIEAVTSFDAYDAIRGEEALLDAAAESLKSRPAEVAERVAATVKHVRELEKALAKAKKSAQEGVTTSLPVLTAAGGYKVAVGVLDDVSGIEDMRSWADTLRKDSAAVVLAAVVDGSALMLAAGSAEAVSKGFDAGAIVKAMAPLVGGRGGGKPAMAQGGGENASGIEAALAAARDLLGA